jgi:hypothetical protein
MKKIIIVLALCSANSFALTYKQAVCKTMPANSFYEHGNIRESCTTILGTTKVRHT